MKNHYKHYTIWIISCMILVTCGQEFTYNKEGMVPTYTPKQAGIAPKDPEYSCYSYNGENDINSIYKVRHKFIFTIIGDFSDRFYTNINQAYFYDTLAVLDHITLKTSMKTSESYGGLHILRSKEDLNAHAPELVKCFGEGRYNDLDFSRYNLLFVDVINKDTDCPIRAFMRDYQSTLTLRNGHLKLTIDFLDSPLNNDRDYDMDHLPLPNCDALIPYGSRGWHGVYIVPKLAQEVVITKEDVDLNIYSCYHPQCR